MSGDPTTARPTRRRRVPPTLETPRLILRAPEDRDAADILGYHRHRSVADGVISIPHPCPPDHGSAWIRRVRKAASETDLLIWVLECRETGAVVGDCGLEPTPQHRRGTLGYILDPDRQGEGLMTEALRRVLRYAFAERDPALERVDADVYPENAPSLRLCERLGFRREGVLRGYIRKDGAQRDAVRFAILRDEFEV